LSNEDMRKADAAADAALEHARGLPPGEERSKAFKEAGRLRSLADGLRRSRLIIRKGRKSRYWDD
jgi:hypothetical protein